MSHRPGSPVRAGDIDEVIQTGVEALSFTDADNHVHSVSFPVAFAGVPNVHVNINSGAGATARWIPRAISIQADGFRIFVFASVPNSDSTWSGIQVAWTAIYRP